ncbi:hypothetical protein FEM48_Zijuj05G0091500 [Ziziphus jujuba var. spinosa]|uniref:SAM dependent carboxyl methyltransferase n=1 Tax=Ziziphus jujuba var. spinosa TaxID=714518 RepID=A0A978VE31_ZIZJJ|nr:hypothetical protein FEM48_Zijuj05G0091500 [Ziziphus jujuba var. spinosa]
MLLLISLKGLISKDKIDTFNLPMYSPSPEELRKLIQKNGCFEIVKLDEQPGGSVPLPSAEGCRAGLETLISNHFGSEIIEQFFDRYAKKVEGRPPLNSAIDGVGPGLFILLKRNL